MDEQFYEDIEIIRSHLNDSALLEQTSEECCELGKALLKKSRKMRGENFTPLSLDEINENVEEEFTDVILCATVLGLKVNMDIFVNKLNRWLERIEHENN